MVCLFSLGTESCKHMHHPSTDSPCPFLSPCLPSRDVAALRPLLAQTRLEKAPLNLIYDAVRDGWKKGDFHRKVDNRGATLVVARTRGGAVCGGYNPEVGREGEGGEWAGGGDGGHDAAEKDAGGRGGVHLHTHTRRQ